MNKIQVLWVDDEVNLLQPHIIFLEEKGYQVNTCQNGYDALEWTKNNKTDVVFLDENMPGISGLEVLEQLKRNHPNLEVVMITKSEEENIMEEAIGSKISDYLIKPVNPNQILLSLKKILDHNRLVSEKTSTDYQRDFQKLNMEILEVNSLKAWSSIYQKLIYWELELDQLGNNDLNEIFQFQKTEANAQFSKYVAKHYKKWIKEECSLDMSHQVFERRVAPLINKQTPTLLLMVDNLRYDQWKVMAPSVSNFYNIVNEHVYCSILPTATQYARNSFFSGMLPSEMAKKAPKLWLNDTDEGGKNLYEKEFLALQLKRLSLNFNAEYFKVNDPADGNVLAHALKNKTQSPLTVVVYNFVDMISHAKTEMDMMKELASSEKAYRSLTLSWFQNSSLLSIIKQAQQVGFQLIITTDHGTINVKNPIKVIGDRETSTNIRYKTGRRLRCESKSIFREDEPGSIGLPSINMSSSFIFAKESNYLIYPSNYNRFVKHFRNSYQHGGISLEEMLIPFVVLSPK